MNTTIEERVVLLREYECDCYQICYYLLNREQLAIDAAKQALLQLMVDDLIPLQNEIDRIAYFKRITIKNALQIYKESLGK